MVVVGERNWPLIKSFNRPKLNLNRQGTGRMFLARLVFRSFRSFEKLGESLLGAVGPYFVATAVVLISTGTVCFCASCPPLTFSHELFPKLFPSVD